MAAAGGLGASDGGWGRLAATAGPPRLAATAGPPQHAACCARAAAAARSVTQLHEALGAQQELLEQALARAALAEARAGEQQQAAETAGSRAEQLAADLAALSARLAAVQADLAGAESRAEEAVQQQRVLAGEVAALRAQLEAAQQGSAPASTSNPAWGGGGSSTAGALPLAQAGAGGTAGFAAPLPSATAVLRVPRPWATVPPKPPAPPKPLPPPAAAAVGPPSRVLRVGGLSRRPSEAQLLEAFTPFGSVEAVRMQWSGAQPTRTAALITYSSADCATAALRALQGTPHPLLTGAPMLDSAPPSCKRSLWGASPKAAACRGACQVAAAAIPPLVSASQGLFACLLDGWLAEWAGAVAVKAH